MRRGKAFGVAATLAATAVVAAGCGSDDDTSSTASPGTTAADTTAAGTTSTAGAATGAAGADSGSGPLTGEAQAEAVAAGEAAGKAAGAQVELPKKTIGMLDVVGGIPSTDRLTSTTKKVAESLGYKYVYCDGQGVPDKQVACANSLLTQGVDAIISTGVDPGAIAGPIRTAKGKGIPVLAAGGIQPPGYDASYGPDESKKGKVLADWTYEKLNGLSDSSIPIAVSDFPTPTFNLRTKELEKVIKGNSKIKVVAKSQPDFANLVQGTQKTVTDQLTANPGLKAFWFAFDTTGIAAGQVIGSKFAGKAFPEKPLLVTFHGDLGTLDLVRKGDIDAVGDSAYEIGVWVAMDQLNEFFARKEKVDPEHQPDYGNGVGQLYSYSVVTKENAPPEGKYFAPETDVVSFFKTKWKTEFGVDS